MSASDDDGKFGVDEKGVSCDAFPDGTPGVRRPLGVSDREDELGGCGRGDVGICVGGRGKAERIAEAMFLYVYCFGE